MLRGMVDSKRMVSFRLTEEARKLLEALAQNRGISRTATLEVLVRQIAEDEGLRRPSSTLREEQVESAA